MILLDVVDLCHILAAATHCPSYCAGVAHPYTKNETKIELQIAMVTCHKGIVSMVQVNQVCHTRPLIVCDHVHTVLETQGAR